MSIWQALLFMAMGGALVHVSWLHAWHMYKSGKTEGRGLLQTNNNRRS